jgi:hypothetical protein
MKRTSIIATLAWMVICGIANASESVVFMTGNQLLAMCQSKRDTTFQFCNGSIQAYVDMLSVDRKICPEKGIVASQTWEVVINFLVNNPADRHHGAASMARDALMFAYPCQEKSQ